MRILALTLALVSLSAHAVFRPGWERPVAKAELEKVSSGRPYPRAELLVKNSMDGNPKFVSFALTEDTGIRCIQAPCPSQVITSFDVIRIVPQPNGGLVYTAVERRHLNPGAIGPMKRTLTVVERNLNWFVTIRHFGMLDEYRGIVEPVYTIQ